ncbi:MAG: hypothetical protein ACLQVD_22455 [Capsulimonadaceae bacterium]
MTLTLELPADLELRLATEAAEAGMGLMDYTLHILDTSISSRKESAQAFFDRIARPGPVIDTSRENIYADF